jgi:[protein-PII] uridylyltransferase
MSGLSQLLGPQLDHLGEGLEGSGASLVELRKVLADAQNQLDENFLHGAPVRDLVTKRAELVDRLLVRLWTDNGLDKKGRTLLATGGYGRGDLHPHSDIDIAVLLAKRPNSQTQQAISKFVTSLWDLGLEVGHSVRTPKECAIQARADITIATNLMEARLLVGDAGLFSEMQRRTGPKKIWPTKKYFHAKHDEQIVRHNKFDDAASYVEPNLKEAPGGLRDLQTISWVAKRHFGTDSLAGLVEHGFLTEEEFRALDAAQAFLWRVRYGLHMITGRREDRVLFDHQRRLAEMFGYKDERRSRAVEQFMKHYYQSSTEISRLNELLLALFLEAIVDRRDKPQIKSLNRRFQTHNDLIEVSNDNVFRRYPFALLEIFLLLQQHPDLKGVRASTIRLIRNHRDMIDDDFRDDIRVRSLFMEIMRQPRRLGNELARMHRYGVLSRYLPVFGAVEGLMQFDLFHVYTVDEHSLAVVRNMRYFSFPTEDTDPFWVQVMGRLPKPELLYLAGMFHDIAKGRGGNHSELGERDALAFCQKHELGDWDTKMVTWLVRNHLDMSETAQKRDLSDPTVINEFAGSVGDVTHLDYLYLLTVADIRGTSPTLWNGWKDSLLKELYFTTVRALHGGLENPLESTERIAENKAAALEMLQDRGIDELAIKTLWSTWDDDYFLRHGPDEVAWQSTVIVSADPGQLPLISLWEQTVRGGTEIFIYTPDRVNLFAITTGSLDALGLNIHDARIFTTRDGFALDTYIVLEAETGSFVQGRTRIKQIETALRATLLSTDNAIPDINRQPDRKLQHFSTPTTVSFPSAKSGERTIMEIVTVDTPGLLSKIGHAMQSCNVRLQNARISTFGERAEDIFYITDRDNKPITDEAVFQNLRLAITATLEAQ